MVVAGSVLLSIGGLGFSGVGAAGIVLARGDGLNHPIGVAVMGAAGGFTAAVMVTGAVLLGVGAKRQARLR